MWNLRFFWFTPRTAGTFRKKSPGSRAQLGIPETYNSRHLKPSEHFLKSLALSTAGDASFFQKWFRRGPLRAGHALQHYSPGIWDIWYYAEHWAAIMRGCSSGTSTQELVSKNGKHFPWQVDSSPKSFEIIFPCLRRDAWQVKWPQLWQVVQEKGMAFRPFYPSPGLQRAIWNIKRQTLQNHTRHKIDIRKSTKEQISHSDLRAIFTIGRCHELSAQIAARYASFWHAVPEIALASSFSASESQHFESQRLQDANATKSQTLAFYKSQRFSATKTTEKKPRKCGLNLSRICQACSATTHLFWG